MNNKNEFFKYKNKYLKYKKKYLDLKSNGGALLQHKKPLRTLSSPEINIEPPSDKPLRSQSAHEINIAQPHVDKCISLDQALNKKCNQDEDPISLELIDYSKPDEYFKYTDTNHCISKQNYDELKRHNNDQPPQNPVSRKVLPCRGENIVEPELPQNEFIIPYPAVIRDDIINDYIINDYIINDNIINDNIIINNYIFNNDIIFNDIINYNIND